MSTLTISVGMAAMNESLESGFQLVELADEALYAAKRAGKNRVMVHSELKPVSDVRLTDSCL